jgi:ribose transport system substrate-binding protein
MKTVYCVPDLENSFWKLVISGIERRAKAGGASVVVVSADHDETRQAEQLQKLLQTKPDAVLVSAVQTRSITSLCKAIRDGGLPIVAVDQNMTTDVTASVISGNLRGGTAAALYLVHRLGPRARLVHLLAESGLENVRLRRSSFLNEIDRCGLKIVKQIQADSSRRKARDGMLAFLTEAVAFDAIFGENDAMALGASDALAERAFLPWPVITGYDGVPEAIEAIRDGRMEATIAQNPETLGEKAMDLVFRILQNRQINDLTTVLPKLVTKADVLNSPSSGTK